MLRLIQQVLYSREKPNRVDPMGQDLALAVARNIRSAKSLDATIEELLEANRQKSPG